MGGFDLLQLETENGCLAVRFRGALCVGTEKSRRVCETSELDDFPVAWLHGDAKGVLDLLSIPRKKHRRRQVVA
jgi:phosphatidylglycerophosphatase C